MGFIAYFAVFLVGMALGVMYFGGLWWTVAALARKRYSVWLLAGSFVVRLCLLTAGLYFVLLIGVWHLAVCVAGVVSARMLLVRFVGCAKTANGE